MASLTLLEQSKRMTGTDFQRAVVMLFADSIPILRVLPFREIAGNSLRYSREHTLPAVGFREINGSYTPSVGVLNPTVETLVITGGEINIDRYITQTMGPDTRAVQESMMIKGIAQGWQSVFFKGDSAADPKQFDGLQRRVTGNQLVDNGSSSGGDPLSLNKLDTAISRVMSPTHLAMSKAMRIRLSEAARNSAVGGYVTFGMDEFGRQMTMYNEIPILEVEDALGEDTVLPFTEANPGGGSAASTSIYVMSIGTGMLEGIQNGGMDVRDLGEQDSTPSEKTRIDWFNAITVQHGRAVARLRGIIDAPATR